MQERHRVVYIVGRGQEDYLELIADHTRAHTHFRYVDSGGAALRISPNKQADVWLIDVRLPDMTGFDLCETLKGRFHASRYILVADQYDEQEELRARSCGATMYLCKPPQSWWLNGVISP
jgi:DNA-binding response OmpR family regulator